jgi:uncharacterized protein involved in copper resistance
MNTRRWIAAVAALASAGVGFALLGSPAGAQNGPAEARDDRSIQHERMDHEGVDHEGHDRGMVHERMDHGGDHEAPGR